MNNGKVSKQMAGGSAAERGFDFQARTNAVVMAHLLAERPIGWLEGVLDDTPVELEAETGGAGDDVRLLTKCGKKVELQAKRGLQRGENLWGALLALARGISSGEIEAGILAVCPDSSGTIRQALAEDIVRLGVGRSEGLREIGQNWAKLLSAACLDASLVCRRLRIVVVSAVDGNREAEATASERLSRITHDPSAIWRALVNCGRDIIRRRGRATPDDIYRELSLAGIAFKTGDVDTRVQLLAGIREWLHRTHSGITVLGVDRAVPFEACWLELDAHVMEDELAVQEELDNALRRYHEYGRRYTGRSFQSQTIGRFIKKCVVLGGPGIGKSTLLKKLALNYSADGNLTLLVRLPQVVALVTREGRRFEDSLLEVALSASGVRAPLVSLDGAVLLCDALDECGSQQPLITAALHAFSVAHPRARVVVTSRPIGYRRGELGGWRHYELQPLSDTAAEQAVLQVLKAIPFPNETARSRAVEFAENQLLAQSIKGAASRSPLMVTLLAALSAKGIKPGHGKASLYRQLFQLLEDHPPPRLNEFPPSEPERRRFLELLGWCLLCEGHEPAEQILSRCARRWSEETGQASLVSEAKIRACLEYWECLGVVERVRTLTQEAITFVHKTFGEFAAARYMSKCEPSVQRDIIARGIQIPAWKEALSFASHLGLGSLILEVWAELAEHGDIKAGYGLDDAVELVVQAGVPVAADALANFSQCCWRAVKNNASRARYAAGEALCLVSRDHWTIVRPAALARLECSDPWIRLVAWACLCVSPDQGLTISSLTDALTGLGLAQPTDTHPGRRLHLGPTGAAVRQHLILGAARRIFGCSVDHAALQALNGLIGDGAGLTVGTVHELQPLFKSAGLDLPAPVGEMWSRNLALMMPSREDLMREDLYLLQLIDDPSVASIDDDHSDLVRKLELGALLTATSFWEMPLSDSLHMSAPMSESSSRRMVIDAVGRAAGLDHARLVRQARALTQELRDRKEYEGFALLALPRVDAEAAFDQPLIGMESSSAMEELILGESGFFALNAAQVLYGLREQPLYANVVERLLRRGRGRSLRISAALAVDLRDGFGQQLILDRLCRGDSTSGCQYLYPHLAPPFMACHADAVRKGLGGQSAQTAQAAAELAAKLPVVWGLADEWRIYFEQWKTKEEPYPKESGVVPQSPRDELAKILVQAFAHDHVFLLELLHDDRPNVRAAAREPFLAAAAASRSLRMKLLDDVETGGVEPEILREALARDLYREEDAMSVIPLLRNSSVHVRYAAMPILDAKFLPPGIVRTEGARLLTDVALDIREEASRALRNLKPPQAEA